MTIKYLPKKILKKMAPNAVVENLVTKNLTLNRTAVTLLERAGVLSAKELQMVALKVIKDYKRSVRDEMDDGSTKREAIDDVLDEKQLMVQRVKNASIAEITTRVKRRYRGEYYRWLPSTAANPDPKHMKKYGKKYQLGRGEAPGDRYGCQCGMEIFVDESRLDLAE